MPAITRIISVTNFVVASSALCFQVGVLYPWHKELDENFEKLKREHLAVLDMIKNSAAEQERKISGLKHQQEEAAAAGPAQKRGGLREWFGLGLRSLE